MIKLLCFMSGDMIVAAMGFLIQYILPSGVFFKNGVSTKIDCQSKDP